MAINVGGVFELVIDGQIDMVVSASDETGLADAIARYVDNPALCREISLRPREKVKGEFKFEDQIDKLASHFGA